MKKGIRKSIIVIGIIGVLITLCAVPILLNKENKDITKLGKLDQPETKQATALNYSNTSTLADVTNDNIGDYIDLGNDPLDKGNTSKNWRILYVEGDTVYAILADYLPNSTENVTGDTTAIDIANIESLSYGCGMYSTRSRTKLLDGFSNNIAWLGLANGIDDAIVTATPTAEQLVKSYNLEVGTNLDYNSFPTLDSTLPNYSLYVPRTEKTLEGRTVK